MDDKGALAIVLGFGMCMLIPLVIVGGFLYVITKKARDRHAERMAMIEKGLVPPPDGARVSASVSGTGPGVTVTPMTPEGPKSRACVRAEFKSEPDPARTIGWAIGLLVTGVLWFATEHEIAAILIGIGAAYLTRGILGLKRDANPPAPPPPPAAAPEPQSFPGDVS